MSCTYQPAFPQARFLKRGHRWIGNRPHDAVLPRFAADAEMNKATSEFPIQPGVRDVRSPNPLHLTGQASALQDACS
jgi:hypothetical protein